ncbi:hydroxyethylthiazole kinase [uncultured Nocardioides sp.]|uniref:hydroxyethylthiazole kinase n=1 Tax=uncultured Nocardioides sp. TaxID=198441 RepID=UPI00261CB5F7|nr:hydroxyethylthiazole kinase [uncultured Nocardioides sp.]
MDPAATPAPADLAEALAALRQAPPLVHCLTNAVVMPWTANGLLALGASPAMVDVPGEAGPFARVASAVLVNLGTPHGEQREAMVEAVDATEGSGTPWVLDPVAVGSLPVRTALAADLLDRRPTVVKGNASEVMALAGHGAGGRGTDSAASVDDAADAARDLVRRTGGVVVVTGPVDLVCAPHGEVRVAGGSPLLAQVTGGGCLLGAVVAAFCATSPPLVAAVAGCASYAVAAERAATGAAGPGSFAVAMLDALAALTPDSLLAARLA